MTDQRKAPILSLHSATKSFQLARTSPWRRRRSLLAVDDVSLEVRSHEAVALVGESGSGKTTLSRLLIGDLKPDTGTLLHHDGDVWKEGARAFLRLRSSAQMVMQNPRSSFDPRLTVRQSLEQPMRSLGIPGREKRIDEVLDYISMDRSSLERHPHEFSGGQLQRLAIARALMPSPDVLVADEPVSALDVSVQAQVLNLLMDLTRDLGLSLVLVSHDLSVVSYVADTAHVMSAGQIVESGPPRTLFSKPTTQQTQDLADAVLTVSAGLEGSALS